LRLKGELRLSSGYIMKISSKRRKKREEIELKVCMDARSYYQ